MVWTRLDPVQVSGDSGMRLPCVRITIRRMMVAAAVAAYGSAVAAQARHQDLMRRDPVDFSLALFFAGVFGVASARHPWWLLPVVILVFAFGSRGASFD